MIDIKLRNWQIEATSKALKWLIETATDHRFLINAAPGSGKTICASVIASELIDKEHIDRVIVIAPRTEVVKQWSEEFKFITGRHMTKVTGSDSDIEEYGVDLCATWSAIQGLLDGFQQVCKSAKTLIICDEHHHAAVRAAWGESADGAFVDAKYAIILSGTPVRSDGKEPIWFAYDDFGQIDHPQEGTYTLTYGEAVDLGYCRPITFHRHEGKFSVSLPDGDNISVSGAEGVELTSELKRIKGLQQALDFYKLACTPKYLPDGTTPDINSYQATMLQWAIAKLDDQRDTIPHAGGLVIAPNIAVAEYMSDLLEHLEGKRPTLVHSQMANAEGRIAAFKNTDKRWLVSVAMISEGVDIKRLRILVYLPSAQTELSFRQAMGRVVRSFGDNDFSRAYVIMPTHKIFEEYARRIENEMSPAVRSDSPPSTTRICPICEAVCPKNTETCPECDHEFPPRTAGFKTCSECESLNPISAEECQVCGHSFRHDFEISLNDALRMGAIVRGMDLDEEEVREGERISKEIRETILSSGDDALVNLIKKLPQESWGRLKNILDQDK